MDTGFDLTTTPEAYPLGHDVRADMVLFVRLTAADYAAASFLDRRMLPPGASGVWKSWAEVRQHAAPLPMRCHFIFHISHVGSTLLARILGQHPRLFSLREPAVLRTLAEMHRTLGRPDCAWSRPEFDDRVRSYLGLWSRTFAPDQTAIIKATSFVSEMAPDLVELVPGSRSVFMIVEPRTFLRTLLGGAISDIADNAAKRLERLHRRLGAEHWRLEDLSDGERVSMSWLCEMLALREAARRAPERTLWLDFDRYLAEPARSLGAVLGHLGVEADDATIRTLLASPIVRQYAKDPQYAYDANFRDQVLQHREQKSVAEIERGLAWLERARNELPAVNSLLAERCIS